MKRIRGLKHAGGSPPHSICAHINARPSMERRAIALALGAALMPTGSARAQPSNRTYRLGILDLGQPGASTGEIEAFTNRLAQLGFVEGNGLVIDRRFAYGDRGRL